MALTRNFWDGFGQGLIIFGLVFPFGHTWSPVRGDVGFCTLLVGVLIRQLGLRFASQSDKGFFSGFVLSWPVIAGIVFMFLAFPDWFYAYHQWLIRH
jgi:hypothetical protein